jgi:hypothetical protein
MRLLDEQNRGLEENIFNYRATGQFDIAVVKGTIQRDGSGQN